MAIYIYDKSNKRLKEIYTDESFKIDQIQTLVSNQDTQGAQRKKKAPVFVSVDARTMYPLKMESDTQDGKEISKEKITSLQKSKKQKVPEQKANKQNCNDVKAHALQKDAKQLDNKSNTNDGVKSTPVTNCDAKGIVEKNIHLKKRPTPKKFANNFSFCHDPNQKSNLDEDFQISTQGQVVDAQQKQSSGLE